MSPPASRNRADEESGPELAATLAAAENSCPVAVRTFEFGLNSRQRLGIGAVRNQKIEDIAENLFTVVPGQGEKAVIGENDRIVGFLRIRKQHRHSGCISGNDERTEVLPKALDFGFGAFLLVRLSCDFRHARAIRLAGSTETAVARTSSCTKTVT